MTEQILKDGSVTNDPRLTRLVKFDEKSRNYPIRTMNDSKTKRTYTWRCNEWLDQGKEGACVAYSLSHELAARPVEVKGLKDQWILNNIYYEAQRNDEWPGGAYPGAVPFYEGTSVLDGVKVLQKAGFYDSYRWAFNIDDLILGIGRTGPAVLGINWYSDMFDVDSNGYLAPTGSISGGHAICAIGVNLKKEHVIFRNSWGKAWGIKGNCYIKFADVEKLLKEDGEAVFPTDKKQLTIESA